MHPKDYTFNRNIATNFGAMSQKKIVTNTFAMSDSIHHSITATPTKSSKIKNIKIKHACKTPTT